MPWTYCWSPSVIPKPKDWKNTTDVSGFYFLDGNTGYQPHADLQAFLDAGEVPIYIGSVRLCSIFMLSCADFDCPCLQLWICPRHGPGGDVGHHL